MVSIEVSVWPGAAVRGQQSGGAEGDQRDQGDETEPEAQRPEARERHRQISGSWRHGRCLMHALMF